MASKKEKVMEALSARGKLLPEKKGVNLLGIVKKLTEKRMEREEKNKKSEESEVKPSEQK